MNTNETEPAPATQGESPRTLEETHMVKGPNAWAPYEIPCVCAAFARQLERELNAAKAERDQARQDLEERCAENDRERAAHLQAYQAVTRERDEARAIIERARNHNAAGRAAIDAAMQQEGRG